MRVVNADKLIEKIVSNFPYKLDIKQYESIWGVPIIEAIPIEWLKDQIRAIPCDKVYFMQPKDVIENLIIQWRWEQEAENE